jgi:hypothetical protein
VTAGQILSIAGEQHGLELRHQGMRVSALSEILEVLDDSLLPHMAFRPISVAQPFSPVGEIQALRLVNASQEEQRVRTIVDRCQVVSID